MAGKRRGTRFLDRSSGELQGDWSVTISSAGSKTMSTSGGFRPMFTWREESLFGVEVELTKQSPKMDVVWPLLRHRASYCVVSPAPKHGFTIDTDKLGQINSRLWVNHLGVFFCYPKSDDEGPDVVPFRNSQSGEEFYLLIFRSILGKPVKGHWNVRIEKTKPEPKGVPFAWAIGTSSHKGDYSAILDEGKVVSVMQRECRDMYVATRILQLFM